MEIFRRKYRRWKITYIICLPCVKHCPGHSDVLSLVQQTHFEDHLSARYADRNGKPYPCAWEVAPGWEQQAHKQIISIQQGEWYYRGAGLGQGSWRRQAWVESTEGRRRELVACTVFNLHLCAITTIVPLEQISWCFLAGRAFHRYR